MSTTIKFSLRDLINLNVLDPTMIVKLIDEKGDFIHIQSQPFKYDIYFISNPAYVKQLTNSEVYIRKVSPIFNPLDYLGRKGLLTNNDHATWFKDRQAITQQFNIKTLKKHIPIFVKTAIDLIESWNNQNFDEKINANNFATQFTTINLLRTLLCNTTIDLNHLFQLTEKLDYLTSPSVYFYYVKLLGAIPLPTSSYFEYKKAVLALREMSDNVVKQSLAQPDENNIIKILAKAYGQENYDHLDHDFKKHLIDHATTFIIVGQETTAITLVNIFVFLSLYPIIADNIQQEIDTILGDDLPDESNIDKFVYTKAVINETLRLNPPIPCIYKITAKDTTLGPHSIKKDSMIFVPIYAIQHDPKYWNNPNGFDPSRFLKPLTDEQKWMYLPFGLGEHSCIGSQFAKLESLILLVMLMRKFRLDLTPESSLKRNPSIMNRYNHEITMRVRKI